MTSLVGTISTTNDKVKLDAANDKIYTSVQWNPVAKAQEETAIGVAFKGQTINAKAKLIDSNANDAAITGTPISFRIGNITLTQGTQLNDGAAYVSAVSNDGKTDANGEVTISFKADDLYAIGGLTAESGDKAYDVVFNMGGVNVSKVDLLWLNPTLKFGKKVAGFGIDWVDCPETELTVDAKKNETWDYGVQIGATFPAKAYLDKTSIKGWTQYDAAFYSGITAAVDTAANKSDAKITDNKNNTATVVFGEKAETIVKFAFTKDSVGSNISGRIMDKDWAHSSAITYVGSGAANLDSTKEIKASLNASETKMSIVASNGTMNIPKAATASCNKEAYILVQDEFGNKLANKDVKLTVSGTKFTATASYGVASDGTLAAITTSVNEGTIRTDSNGIAKFTLEGLDNIEGTATVIASNKEAGTTKAEFKWVDATKNPLKVTPVGKYDAKTNTITLTMTEPVVSSSVSRESFESGTTVGSGTVGAIEFNSATYLLDSASASGKTITLKVTDNFKESIDNTKAFTISLLSAGYTDANGTTVKVTCDTTGEELAADVSLSLKVLDNGTVFADDAGSAFDSDNAKASWTVSDFNAFGITGVTAENISAVKSAMSNPSPQITASDIKSSADLNKAKKAIQDAVDAALLAVKTAAETAGNNFKTLHGKLATTDKATIKAVTDAYAALDAYSKKIADAKIAAITTEELTAADRKAIDAVAVQAALTAAFVTPGAITATFTSAKKLDEYAIFGSKVKLDTVPTALAAYLSTNADGKLVINPTGAADTPTPASTAFKIQVCAGTTAAAGDYELSYTLVGSDANELTATETATIGTKS